MQYVDINTGIRSTLAVLKNNLHKISVIENLDESLPMTICQLGKLNQVFLNLLNNAIHAVEERYKREPTQSKIEITSRSDQKNIYITIEDNGTGIPEEIQNKIFEPFYTSKPIGKGTGLGLSISYAIIEDHDGALNFRSQSGHGTWFEISIPIRTEDDIS
jgi:signal transduction histidine kinase